MILRLIIVTTSYLVSLNAAFAFDDFGPPKELVLNYGKSIVVGDEYSASVKTLEEEGYACNDARIGYDQLILCQPGIDLVIEGELVVDF